MFSENIETECLQLERISHDIVDVFDLHEFYSDGDETGEMFKYWDSSPHETMKETYDYLDEAENLWDEAEGAKYVIRPKEGEDGARSIAGTTGLYLDWEKQSANLGIILDKRFWGGNMLASVLTPSSPSRSTGLALTSWSPLTSMEMKSLDE